jgi:general secretion pathway protein D
MFAHSRTETNQTDIVLTLTPHIIRVLEIGEEDLRAFRVGRDSLAPVAELPPAVDIPPPTPPAAAPPAGTAPPVEPGSGVPPSQPAPSLPGSGTTQPPG